MQEWGKHSWDVADASPVTVADVDAARAAELAELDASFFRVQFDRLTLAEKRYLRDMVTLGPGPHRSGDVADQMQVKVSSVASAGNSLIAKGILFSPAHGDHTETVVEQVARGGVLRTWFMKPSPRGSKTAASASYNATRRLRRAVLRISNLYLSMSRESIPCGRGFLGEYSESRSGRLLHEGGKPVPTEVVREFEQRSQVDCRCESGHAAREQEAR